MRRRATAWIDEPIIVDKLFVDLAKRFPDRTSGYTRVTRLARRVGDNSPLMLIELMPGVDETKGTTEAEAKPRRRRLPFRRGASEAGEAEGEKKPAAKAAKKTAAKKTTTRKKTTAKA